MALMVPPEIGNSPAAMLAPLPGGWRNYIPTTGTSATKSASNCQFSGI